MIHLYIIIIVVTIIIITYLHTYLLTYLITALELSLGGNSPYTSTDKTLYPTPHLYAE